MMGKHSSHVTRVAIDASSFDVICINCGATDGRRGELANDCPTPPGKGGITLEEWYEKEKEESS